MKRIIFTILAISIFSSCSKKEDSNPTPSNPAPEVPKTQWFSYKTVQADTADVRNGYLYMTSKYSDSESKGTSVGTVKKIKGDFELLVKFSSFKPTGSGIFPEGFGVILSATETPHGVISAILGRSMMFAGDSAKTNAYSKLTTNRDGEWYVKRVGSTYTSWFRAGSDTLKINKTNYITSDLSFNFSVISYDNTTTSTSVHIDDFMLTGGGTDVKSDPFDENDITDIVQ